MPDIQCAELSFSRHAIQRMFARGLKAADVRAVIATGEIIAEYPDDQPYPSYLVLGFVNNQSIHVVVARTADGRCRVITAYIPDPAIWMADFRTRRSP
ncbi:MAG: DUF4258 domain-containing protein [Pseudomonadota bacterium]|nr:DUF4258 domain-containing protein [Pseudomonadota bacterium]